MTNSSAPDPVDLSDPTISPHRLQELAQTHPEQWDEILEHPNVYAGLADWIRNRQAELAATGSVEATDDTVERQDEAQHDAEQPDEDATPTTQTKVFEDTLAAAAETPASDETPAPDRAPDETPGLQETSTTQHPAQEPVHPSPAASPWTGPAGPQHQGYHPTTQQPHYSAQPYQQQPAYGQQPSSAQPGYGQQQYGGPFVPRQRNAASTIFSTLGAWMISVAGGAAFLGLFGFFFDASYGSLPTSHLAAGGWIIVLMFIATVVLALLQLLKPSRWMRFAFLAVSLGAGFMMFARAITYFGFFTMRGTGVSVLWLLAMSIIMLIASLVYLAQQPVETTERPAAATPQPTHRPSGAQYGGYQPGPYQQPGQYPHDYGQHPGGYGPSL